MLEKTLESPLNCKEIKPVHPNGNQSWIFIGRTDAEAEAPILWPPDAKNWLIGKDPDTGKDLGQGEKGTTEDEMVGWHHWLDGHELEQALGVGDGQGSLVCCSPGSQRVGHDWATELNWTNMSRRYTFLMIWMWSSRSPTANHLQCNDNKQVHRSRRDKTKAQISQHHSQTPTSLSSRGSPAAFTWCNSLCLVPFFCPSFFPSCYKKKVTFATKWMNLHGIMPSEISQTEKDKFCIISLIGWT